MVSIKVLAFDSVLKIDITRTFWGKDVKEARRRSAEHFAKHPHHRFVRELGI